MDYDYTEGVCLTAKQHQLELIKQLRYTINVQSDQELSTYGFILEEYGRIIEKLEQEYEGGELLTITYYEGMNVFEIEEGMKSNE